MSRVFDGMEPHRTVLVRKVPAMGREKGIDTHVRSRPGPNVSSEVESGSSVTLYVGPLSVENCATMTAWPGAIS